MTDGTKSPQHIQYLIDASVENQRGVEQLLRNLQAIGNSAKAAQERLTSLQKQVNAGLGVQAAPQARQMGAILAAYGAGDLDTRFRNQSGRRARAEIDADNAVQVDRNIRALERQHKSRLRFLQEEMAAYEKMAALASKARGVSSKTAGPAGDVRRQLESYLDPLIVSKAGAPLRGAPRNSKIDALLGQMAAGQFDPGPIIRQRTSWMGLSNQDFSRALASAREVRREDTERRKEQERITRELQEQRRLQEQLRVQTATDKSIRRSFMRQHGDALRGLPPADMDTYFRDKIEPLRRQLSQAGHTAIYEDVQDLKRKADRRDADRRMREDAAWVAMRERADMDNRAFDTRRQREREAPTRMALNANARADALGGAGLMSIQGKLLANYATMGAGIGSAFFLGNFVVQYEQSLKQLQAIADATSGEMMDLDKTIIRVATNSKFSANEIANAATTMAQAGLSVRQIDESLKAVVDLAVATGTDLATTVDIVTSTMTIFDLQSSEAGRVVNTLTAAMNLSKLSMDKFALGLQYSGNIAETLGVKYNELAALMGGMTDAGIKSGSTLGTGLRQLLLDLQAPTDKAKGVFDRLGLSSQDLDIESQGVFRVLQNLKDAGLTTADATEAFEVRAVAAFKALMNQLPRIKELNEQILMTEAATKAAGTQMDTMAAQWNRFTQGAGAAFYKATVQIRDVLKAVFGGLADIMGSVDGLGALFRWAANALALFITGAIIIRLAKLVQGFGDLRAAIANTGTAAAATATRVGVLGTALNFVQKHMGALSLIITAVSGLMAIFGGNSEEASQQMEALSEATNRARGEADATKETITALDTAISELTRKYGVLSGGASEELNSVTAELQSRFAQYGLTLDETGERVETLTAKSAKLRAQLAETLYLQQRTELGSLIQERDAAAAEFEKTFTSDIKTINVKGETFKQKGPLTRASDALKNSKLLWDRFPDLSEFVTFSDADFTAPNDAESEKAMKALLRRSGRLGQLESFLKNQRTLLEDGSEAQMTLQEVTNLTNTVGLIRRQYDQMMGAMSKLRNFDVRMEMLDDAILQSEAEKTPEFARFSTQAGLAAGRLDAEIGRIISTKGTSPDKLKKDLETFAKSDAGQFITELDAARQALFAAWKRDGVAFTDDKAMDLLKQSPSFDEYMYVQNAVKQSVLALDPKARKRIEDAAKSGVSAANAQMAAVVAESRVPKNMKIPSEAAGSVFSDIIHGEEFGGDTHVIRRSFEESMKLLDDAASKYFQNLRTQFEAEFPNAFKNGPDGQLLDPSGFLEWQNRFEQGQSVYNRHRAMLAANYGRDDPSQSSSRGLDADVELLEGKVQSLKSKLEETLGSFDAQSDPGKIAAAIIKAKDIYAELETASVELENLKWDNGPWKSTERAGELRRQRMDFLRQQLSANEGKRLADAENTNLDAIGRLMSRAAKQSRQSMERQLAALPIDSSTTARARIDIANSLINSIAEEFSDEFWNAAENRERRGVQEAVDEFNGRLSEIIAGRFEIVMAILDNEMQEATYRQGTRMRQLQGRQRNLDNVSNTGRVSQTERYMLEREMAVEDTNLLGMNLSNLVGRRSQLEDQLRYYTLMTAMAAPGSSAAASGQNNLLQTQKELLQVTRELEQATLDYANALGLATDPSFGELFKAAVNVWAEGEGVLLSWAETVADTLPGIFSNATSSITGTLGDIASHARDTGDAVKDMARSILRSLLDMALKIAANQIIQMILRSAGAFSGGPTSDPAMAAYPDMIPDNYAQAGGYGFSQGGEVHGPVKNRDSVRAKLMPGEIVMRKTAVDMIGRDTLLRMNRTGQLANSMSTLVMQQKREPDMANIYVVAPGKQPSMGPRDVIVALTDDVLKDGQSKKLIRAVALGQI